MEYKNFFKWLELTYRIDINKQLQNTLTEHFGESLNIYTDQICMNSPEKSYKNIKINIFKASTKSTSLKINIK